MDTVEFMRWAVPQGNNYTAMMMPNKNGKGTYPSHRNFTSQKELAGWAVAVAKKHSRDMYFALASFKVGEVKDDAAGTTKPERKQKNVSALRSFWADIDCKGVDGTYMDKREAIAALGAEISKGTVPNPSIIVDSGNGLHVYWCLDEDMHPDDWQPVAYGFRNMLLGAGIKIDEGITIDSARILRVPGTHNYKDPANPKPVTIMRVGERLTWDDVAHYAELADASLQSYHSALGGSLAGALVEGTDEDFDLGELGGLRETDVLHMEFVTTECPQMDAMLANGGADVPEPIWKGALLVAARCADGRKYAHLISKGHADYNEAATDAKFDRQVEVLQSNRAGPTTCRTFEAWKPSICAMCPHRGAVKTPALLGREATGLPPTYQEKVDGIYQTVKADDGEHTELKRVCRTKLGQVQLYPDREQGPTLVGKYKAGNIQGQFALTHAKLSSPVGRCVEAVNRAGLMIAPNEMKHFQSFMMDYATYLRTRKLTVPPPKAIGWNEQRTSFHYRRRQFTDKGEVEGLFIDDPAFDHFREMGSRDAWFEAEKHMLKAPLELQLIVLLSFAAPLVTFTGMDGFVFSFRSSGSGRGKTAALRMGASLWGDPVRVGFSMSDTPKSVLRRIGLTPNLPAYWDEVRVVGDPRHFEALTKTLFEIAQGREMSRLRSDTSFNTSGAWKTLLGVCTNESLIDLASSASSGPEPVLARMLEVDLPEVPQDATGPAAVALTALQRNYGFIGPEYIRHIVPQREEIARTIDKLSAGLGYRIGTGVKRYWTMAAATMVVAAQLANKAGLFRIDTQAVFNLLVNIMEVQSDVHATAMAEGTNDYMRAFREWFLATQDYWLITKDAPSLRGRPATAATQILADPRSPMLFHADITSGLVRVKTSLVNEWCRKQALPPVIVRRALTPKVQAVKVTIGAGTAFADTQSSCLEFDMDQLGLRDAIMGQVNRVHSFGGRL
jgi:hypothetical protein